MQDLQVNYQARYIFQFLLPFYIWVLLFGEVVSGKENLMFYSTPQPLIFFCFHEYNLVSSSDTENIMLMSALYRILGDFMSRIDFLWQCIQFSFSTLIFLDSSEFITQHQYTIEIGIIASWKIFSWCIIDMLLVLFNFSKVCQILEGV